MKKTNELIFFVDHKYFLQIHCCQIYLIVLTSFDCFDWIWMERFDNSLEILVLRNTGNEVLALKYESSNEC